jgi:hypothetical protein
MTNGLQHPLLRTAVLILVATVLLWTGVLIASSAPSADPVSTPASRTPAKAAVRPLLVTPNCSSGCTGKRQEKPPETMRVARACSTCNRHHDDPSSPFDQAVAGTPLASFLEGFS